MLKMPAKGIDELNDAVIDADRRKQLEKGLLAAIDEVERGECATWHPGEAHTLLQDLIRQRSMLRDHHTEDENTQ